VGSLVLLVDDEVEVGFSVVVVVIVVVVVVVVVVDVVGLSVLVVDEAIVHLP